MSSGLLFFTSDDFHTENGQKGKILCTDVKGLCVILFYSTMCCFCNKFLPDFKTLPGKIGGCQFGMVNVNNNKELVVASSETIVPIKYVPYLILYVNGKPYIRYDGEHNSQSILQFIIDANKKITERANFMNQQNKKEEEDLKEINGVTLKYSANSIPKYTHGIPKKDEITYLPYGKAYNERKKNIQ